MGQAVKTLILPAWISPTPGPKSARLREQQNGAASDQPQQRAKANLAVTQLQKLREHAAPTTR